MPLTRSVPPTSATSPEQRSTPRQLLLSVLLPRPPVLAHVHSQSRPDCSGEVRERPLRRSTAASPPQEPPPSTMADRDQSNPAHSPRGTDPQWYSTGARLKVKLSST